MPEKVKEDKAKEICACMHVTDHEIEDAVLEGARTYLEVQEHTKAGTVCGECREKTEELLAHFIEKHFKK